MGPRVNVTAVQDEDACVLVGVGEGPTAGVFVGGTGVFVLVEVGDGPTVGVLVGGSGVAVGPPGPTREMSSNQISPVGEPSVIRRSVTLVFDPLAHVPVRNCQLPVALVHNCL